MEFESEEVRDGFRISKFRKLLWKKEISMLEWLESICVKENINYFLIGGSEIGAVRHKGFIPWDDDIDLGMLRSDFDRFLLCYEKYIPENYSIQYGLDKEHGVWSSLLRIRDNTTTGIIHNQIGKLISHGCFIEVYCYDAVPESQKKQKEMARKISQLITVLRDRIGQKPYKGIKSFFVKAKFQHLSDELIVKKIEKECKKYSNSGSKYVSTAILPYYLLSGSEVLLKEDVASTISIPFEYTTVRIPIGYDRCLRKQYGEYMELPPVEERGQHHSTQVFYDPTKPYTAYKETSMQELFDKYGYLI